MPKQFDEIDKQVIERAKELFLLQGIEKTEMKVIAEEAGISRRTLYRRFQQKENIAFYVAAEILKEFYTFEEPRGETGYEKFRFLQEQELLRMKQNPEKVHLLDEFDQKFADDYPGGFASEDYELFNAEGYGAYQLKCRCVEEGMKDGSIRAEEDPRFLVRSFEQAILGICQRILPREKHILREQGFGEEFVDDLFERLMFSIKGEH